MVARKLLKPMLNGYYITALSLIHVCKQNMYLNSFFTVLLFVDQSKLTSIAKSIIKICKQEMSEIENCATCYLNANTKKNTWFVEVCPKPHLLVWAKLRGKSTS